MEVEKERYFTNIISYTNSDLLSFFDSIQDVSMELYCVLERSFSEIFKTIFRNSINYTKTLIDEDRNEKIKINKKGITYIPKNRKNSIPVRSFDEIFKVVYMKREEIIRSLRDSKSLARKADDLEKLFSILDYFFKRLEKENIINHKSYSKCFIELDNPIIYNSENDSNKIILKKPNFDILIENKENNKCKCIPVVITRFKDDILKRMLVYELSCRKEEIKKKSKENLKILEDLEKEINQKINKTFYDYIVMKNL